MAIVGNRPDITKLEKCVFIFYPGISASFGMFERDITCCFLVKVTLSVAFMAGSSKQGNALRASVDSNCVVARYL